MCVVPGTPTLTTTARGPARRTAMLLVPRQLQRHGMTGAVPYYGGRLTPWHINAIKDQAQERAQASARQPVRTQQGVLEALTHLWNSGILTPEEFNELRARAGV